MSNLSKISSIVFLDGSLNFPYICYSSFVLSPMGKDYKTEANY